MINTQTEENRRQSEESYRPGGSHRVTVFLQKSRQDDKPAFGGDGGHAVKGGADADESRLARRVQPQHIKAVGGCVVRGGRKGHDPENRQRVAQKIRRREGQSHTGERPADDQLCQQNPEAFGAEKIYKRAPKRLDYPGKIKPAGVKGDICVGQTKIFIHHHTDGHDDHIGDALGHIYGRHPQPGVSLFFAGAVFCVFSYRHFCAVFIN